MQTVIGKVCPKHRSLEGLRYSPNRLCVECAKEKNRACHALREVTIPQEIKQLKAEVKLLRKAIDMQRSLIHSLRAEIQGLIEHPEDAL